jgi:hypothetical protein
MNSPTSIDVDPVAVNVSESLVVSLQESTVVNTVGVDTAVNKYKIRLIKPTARTPSNCEKAPSHTYETIQKFLDDEKLKNKFETWNKLNKSIKYKKLQEYVCKYTQTHTLIEDESVLLLDYLTSKINTGQLARSKDVMYDKTSGVIRDIPGILFNRTTRHITMKNSETRHITTVKNLKTILKNTEDI